MAKLTKRVVEAATPRDTDYFIWCGELPGFGVRIFASGRRSYLAQYRAEGRSRRVTLGTHPVIQTEEARKAALALLGDVARGENPAEEESDAPGIDYRRRALRPLPHRCRGRACDGKGRAPEKGVYSRNR